MKNNFVKVNNTNFIFKNKNIIFKGLGIGSWLNMEHFMLGIPTPDNQIRKAFQDIYGKENSACFFDSLVKSYITENDFKFLKKCKINLIRVPFNYRLFIDDNNPDEYKKIGFEYFDYLIALCKKYNIFLLPDLHTTPGGQNPDWHSDNNTGIPQFWHYKVFRNQISKLWGEISKRYKDESTILGWDLLNEPFIISEDKNILNSFYQETTKMIRKYDKNHIIFLEGDNFAMNFDILDEIKDKNTALTFHYYPTVWDKNLLDKNISRDKRKKKFANILDNITSIRKTFSRPILCGEAGYDIDKQNIDFSMMLLEDTISLFDERKISWTIWCYKDAQFMGLVYPKSSSPWMVFVNRLKKDWGHYREMENADKIIDYITCLSDKYKLSSKNLKYYMQFRQRGILYKFQSEYILKPLLKEYSYKEIMDLPKSFLFKNCSYYDKYFKLLKKYCSKEVE